MLEVNLHCSPTTFPGLGEIARSEIGSCVLAMTFVFSKVAKMRAYGAESVQSLPGASEARLLRTV